MHRFYCPNTNFSKTTITITEQSEIHHLRDVLRLKTDDRIIVFDGRGKEAAGTIMSINRSSVRVLTEKFQTDYPNRIKLILACAIPKKSKFETIIEKSTELGIDEIIPLITQRTQVRINNERMKEKILRFEKVALNAAKQSNRKTIPVIHPITPFPSALKFLQKDGCAFLPCLFGNRENLMDILTKIKPHQKIIIFFIGPEGDFTPDEVSLAVKKGCTPVSLGETTLKVDTAAAAIVAATKLFLSHEG